MIALFAVYGHKPPLFYVHSGLTKDAHTFVFHSLWANAVLLLCPAR